MNTIPDRLLGRPRVTPWSSPLPTVFTRESEPLPAPTQTHAHGSLLCQDTVGRVGLGSVVAGSGSDLSEEPVLGCEPVTLEPGTLPGWPPGPVFCAVTRSSRRVL